MTTLSAEPTTTASRETTASRLIDFAQKLCASQEHLRDEDKKAAGVLLGAVLVEWAIANNHGITEFSGLLFAAEATLSEYSSNLHDYYEDSTRAAGAAGLVLLANMKAIGAKGERYVQACGALTHRVLLRYMRAKGLLRADAED